MLRSKGKKNRYRRKRLAPAGVRRNQSLGFLLALAETATQSLDTEKIIRDTLDKSLEVLGFDLGYIRILDSQTGSVVVRAMKGLRAREHPSHNVKLQESRRHIANVIFETRKPYIAPDVRKDSTFRNRTMEQEGVVSAVYIPIMSKERVLGTLAIGSRKKRNFSNDKIAVLAAFGSQLGIALENAQLYEEVLKGKAYIESLVENAADAIISTDVADVILTWNRGAEVLFGYGKEEAVGKPISILAPADRLHEGEEIRTKVEISGSLRNIEVRSQRKDGVIIHLSLSVSAIRDAGGKIVGFLRVAKDISDKKRFERRLKELDRMKSDFVSNVSHELRTPLTAIKGSVDNMLDGITGPLLEKQTRYLARIKANADRLGRLITDLLDLSKIESGKIDLRPSRLAATLLVSEIADMLRTVASEKLINLEVASGDPTLSVWADRDKVVQILMNLVGNALKFTPAQGRVTIAVDQQETDWVKFSIADTGPGIPGDEATKIFDKFYQVEHSNKQKSRGTGLGLAISKALVEMHGGRIWIDSAVNGGSTFSFTLPARQPLES